MHGFFRGGVAKEDVVAPPVNAKKETALDFLTNSKGQASACGVLRNSDDEGLPGSSGSCMQSCGHVYKVKTGEADAHEAISSHTSLDKLAKLAIGPDYTPPVEVTAHISNDAMGTKFE
ncbi:hypothetical protein V6N11_038138 [Hibiscus sabdariffa]|uniref:Uncharacterized protein n=1 Tax=Hibiscus sabdariffa TaxID=183260 RepID=A0ABR2SJR5_9ROSI